MNSFSKQLIFLLVIVAIFATGVLVIKSATPQGKLKIDPDKTAKLKVNPILGHDLDLNALYYAQAANNTVHDITTQDISISAWVKVDVDSTGNGGILGKTAGTSASGGYLFYLAASTNKIRIWMNDKTDTYRVDGNTSINDNKWHHITGIIDKSDATQSKVFVDGVDNTATRTGTLGDIGDITSASTMALGNWAVGKTNYLDGQIRDVKLYYAAGDHWTDAQVLYQAQHPFDYTSNAGTLTDYWRLDEGTGTTLYGKPVGGNNLTLSNALAWTTQPKVKVSTGLVGYWKLDDNTTTAVVKDYSGKNNNGSTTVAASTATSTATFSTSTAEIGRAMFFDGLTRSVRVSYGTSSFANLNSVFSVSFWAYRTGTNVNNGWGYVSYRGQSTNGWTIVGTDSSGSLKVYDGTTYRDSTYDLPIGQWVFVAVVGDVNRLSFYINGSLTTTTSFVAQANQGVGIDLGRFYVNWAATNLFYNGILDEVKVWNYARSAEEIYEDYVRGTQHRP